MTNLWLNVLNALGLAWWIEVKTDDCTYFFGPFSDQADAEAAQPGYIEDLEQDGETNIQATLMKCKPSQLTDESPVEEAPQNPALVYIQ